MGALSDYSENKVLDHVLKTAEFSVPTNLYLCLCTADPTDAGTGSTIVEPVGFGYARVQCNADFASAVSRAITTDGIITFPEATGAWGTITHFAICDADTAGNMLLHGTVTPNKVIASGDNPWIAVGDLDASVDAGGMSDFLANGILDHILKVAPYSQPTSIFVALSDVAITDSDTGSTITEPGAGSYARKEHNVYDVASGGASENTGVITFATATAGWGTITHFALLDHLTTGNLLFHAALDDARNIGVGDIAEFADGALDITLD